MSAIVANCAINLRCELTKPVKVEYIDGNMFSMDNAGNTAHVYIYYNGQPQEIVGSVSAEVIRPDGGTVAVTGAMSGNRAYVIFPQAVYAVPGAISCVIKVTEGTTTTTIAAFVANVYRSSTDQAIDPGQLIPSISSLISAIETAVGSIPADYSSLLATIAGTYSSSKTYNVGDYAWESGVLKRCIVPITAGETFTAAHWTNAVVCDDLSALKTAFNGTNRLIGNVDFTGTPNEDGTSLASRIKVKQYGNVHLLNNTSPTAETTSTKQRLYRLNDGVTFQTVTNFNSDTLHFALKDGHLYRFLVKKISGSVTKTNETDTLKAFVVDSDTTQSGENSPAVVDITALTGEQFADFTAGTSESINIVLRTTNGITCTNLMIAVYLLDLTEILEFVGVDDEPTEGSKFPVSSGGVFTSKLDSTYDAPIDWAEGFGNDDYPLGWQTGYFNSSGATGTSDDYMRTVWRSYYTAKPGDKELVFTVPSGYHAAIAEYDGNGSNGTRHGGIDSGSNTVSVQLTEGYRYKFCIGKWDGDAGDDITSAFLENVTATVKRSFLEWQKEQDARLDAIAGASDIPEYYTAYLQTKLNTITTLQKSLSEKNDGFIFITDYHIRTNRGHSLALIKEVARKTGLQKIFFAGDAGGRIGGDSGYVQSMQKSAKVWSDLAGCAEAFYGALGNHEWIDGSVYGKGAMFANYLNRFKQTGKEMSANGSYYIEDPVCKIRYYFIQDSWGASALDYDWFGKSLEAMTENGWYIAVIAHHGYIPGSASEAEYDGVEIDTSGASHVIARVLTRILEGYQAHTTVTTTISGTSYSWDFSNTSGGGSIGVFCGHYHHGTLFDKDDEENEWGIPVWRASTDSMQAGSVFEEYEGQKVPWYWEGGTIGGTKVIRTPGTTDEQCFYAVQIDMEAQTVYITAIGGDHDWEFEFGT